MEKKFCHLCGSRLEQKEATVWWCPNCEFNQYANPKPATELILYRDGKILVSKRSVEPGKGKFDMPGGFVELGENAEQGLVREIEEELGVRQSDYSAPSYLWTYNIPYPFGKEVYQVLCVVFTAELKNGVQINALDDVAAVQWISEQEVNDVPWALPVHKENARLAFARYAQ